MKNSYSEFQTIKGSHDTMYLRFVPYISHRTTTSCNLLDLLQDILTKERKDPLFILVTGFSSKLVFNLAERPTLL